MENIFGFIVLLALIALFLGIIKPSLVMWWKNNPTRLNVIKLYGLILIISFIGFGVVAPKAPQDTVQNDTAVQKHQIQKENIKQDLEKKQNETYKQNLDIKTINISDGFTLNNKQAVSIYLMEDENNLILLTLEKGIVKPDYMYSSDTDKSDKPPVTIQAFFGEPRKYYRFYDTNNTFKMMINKYSEDTREATIAIDAVLRNVDNRDDVMRLKDVQFAVNGKAFDMLKDDSKNTKIRHNTNDPVKKKETISITSKNIEKVIKSLKKNYDIKATAFMNDELNKHEMCWNDRACEIYADKVQIQATFKNVEALTSSSVSPRYYQKVCSAIMIGLTGANKELIEQQISQYFNYASQNGRNSWKALGVEITIRVDSNGLLGCGFYKQSEY